MKFTDNDIYDSSNVVYTCNMYIGMRSTVKTGMLIIPPTRAAHFIDLPGVLSRLVECAWGGGVVNLRSNFYMLLCLTQICSTPPVEVLCMSAKHAVETLLAPLVIA